MWELAHPALEKEIKFFKKKKKPSTNNPSFPSPLPPNSVSGAGKASINMFIYLASSNTILFLDHGCYIL